MDPNHQSEHEVEVDVGSVPGVTFEEVAPLLDALAWRFGSVQAKRGMPPSMTGTVVGGPDWLDVAIIALVLRAGYAFTGKIFERLADDSYSSIRRWLLSFRKLPPEKQRELRQRILLDVDGLRFHFDQSITDEEFRLQLTVGQRHIDAGATAGDWFWDERSGIWRTTERAEPGSG